MAFLLNKESEEEFDAEGDRYEELRSKLLGGRTMKYEEMEELLAAAKSRGDQKVTDVLKNVVDDPPADGVSPLAESDDDGEKLADAVEGILGEILGLFGVDESADGAEEAAENIKKILDKAGLKGKDAEKAIAAAEKKAAKKADPAEVKKAVKQVKAEIGKLDESGTATGSKKEPTKSELLDKLIKMCEPGSGVRNALEEIKDKFALGESIDPTGAPLDLLTIALDGLKGRGDLTADDTWIEDSDKLVLSYENVGWYEGLNRWAEDPEDDVESDLAKIYDALLESGYGLQYSRSAVKAAIDDAAAEAASDPESLKPKENRFGDWDYTATCNVYIPFEISDGPADVLPEDDEIEEKEELLPDCVVDEAVETLRRMY